MSCDSLELGGTDGAGWRWMATGGLICYFLQRPHGTDSALRFAHSHSAMLCMRGFRLPVANLTSAEFDIVAKNYCKGKGGRLWS